MKKIGLMVVTVALSLSVAASASSVGDAGRSTTERPARKDKKGVSGTETQSPKTLADQIAQLKQEHQAVINELEQIKKLAIEEKAPKTQGAVERAIIRRNQEFQKRLEPLEQLQKRLDATQNPKNKKGGSPATENLHKGGKGGSGN